MDKNYVYGDFLVSAHSHNAPNLLKIVAPRPDEGLKNLKSTFFEMFSNGVKTKSVLFVIVKHSLQYIYMLGISRILS